MRTEGLYTPPNELDFGSQQRLSFSTLMRAGESAAAELKVVQPQIAGADTKLIGRIRQLVSDKASVLFAVPDRASRESLELRLNDEGIPFVESLGAAAENSVPVTSPAATRDVVPLRRGFAQIVLVTIAAGERGCARGEQRGRCKGYGQNAEHAHGPSANALNRR